MLETFAAIEPGTVLILLLNLLLYVVIGIYVFHLLKKLWKRKDNDQVGGERVSL